MQCSTLMHYYYYYYCKLITPTCTCALHFAHTRTGAKFHLPDVSEEGCAVDEEV